MTDTATLLSDLENADMLLIDGLHAWQFELDDQGRLSVECMDGRVRRVWHFTAEALAAAQPADEPGSWRIQGGEGEHELVCLGAISADNDDQDDDPDEVD